MGKDKSKSKKVNRSVRVKGKKKEEEPNSFNRMLLERINTLEKKSFMKRRS